MMNFNCFWTEKNFGESEREDIRKRQEQGVAAAKAKGVHIGQPAKNAPNNFEQFVKLWEKKKIPLEQVLKECNMAEATLFRRLREYRL